MGDQHRGVQFVSVAFLPEDQRVCDYDFSGTDLAGTPQLPDPTRIALDDGWQIDLQPLPKVDNSLKITADICTATTVVTPSLPPQG